jgi:hypothetical protein
MECKDDFPAPILCAHLLREVDGRLLELLGSLRADEWDLATVAPEWRVRDVAAHLLDSVLRKLSLVRDRWSVEEPSMRSPQGLAALVIPIARHQIWAREQTPHLGILHTLLPIGAPSHDVQQRLKRRTSGLHAAILEVLPGHPRLGFHNGVHARRELDDILLFGTEHLPGDYGRRRFEKPSQEPVDEERRNPVSQAAGRYSTIVQAEIANLFQVSVCH